MTVTLGSWYIIALGVAIGVAVVFFMGHQKTQQYKNDVRGKIKVVIHRGTGWPLVKIVPEGIDGWVSVGKGEYKLPNSDEQRKIFEKEVLNGGKIEDMSDEDRLKYFGQRKTIPSAMEWSLYPDRPFRTAHQVPIRKCEWWENDPHPITWLHDKEPTVTSAVARAHTLQLDAVTAGTRAQELENQSKKMMEAFTNMVNKNFVYILLVANVAIGVIVIVLLRGGKIGV